MISDGLLRRLLGSDSAVALLGTLVRVLLALVLLVVIVWQVIFYAAMAREMFVSLHMNDFGKFYYATRAFLDGGDMYAPNAASAMPVGGGETREFANMNPPHFHLLILPLARLSPLAALGLWSLLSALALAVSIRLVTRELGIRWTPTGALWTTAGLLTWSATNAMVVTGQVTFLLLLPFTLAWIDGRHQRWTRAAFSLGVLASLKPFFGLFLIYLLLRKQIKAAAVMIAAAIACVGLGLAVFGWPAHEQWLHALGNVEWGWAVMNGSIYGVFSRTLASNPLFTPLVERPQWIAPLTTLVGGAIAVLSLVAANRSDAPAGIDRGFALLLLASLLASPLGWVYYLWLGVGPFVATVKQLLDQPRRWSDGILLLAIPGLLCPLYMTIAWRSEALGGLTLGSIYAWTTLALWLSAMTVTTAQERSSRRG